MKQFIKLTHMVVNPRYIQSIQNQNNKMIINLINPSSNNHAVFIWTTGWIDPIPSQLLVEQNSHDYKIMENWINNNSISE
jgi:hypothetical protein